MSVRYRLYTGPGQAVEVAQRLNALGYNVTLVGNQNVYFSTTTSFERTFSNLKSDGVAGFRTDLQQLGG